MIWPVKYSGDSAIWRTMAATSSGGTGTAGRDLFCESRQLVRFQKGIHGCVDHAAGNGIYLNAAGCQLLGQSFCQGVDPSLGGRVGSLCGSTDIAPYGGDVDDPAVFFLQQIRNDRAACIKDGGKVRAYQGIPLLRCHILKQTEVGDPCVVDNDLRDAEGADRIVDKGLRILRIPHIAIICKILAAGCGDPGLGMFHIYALMTAADGDIPSHGCV